MQPAAARAHQRQAMDNVIKINLLGVALCLLPLVDAHGAEPVITVYELMACGKYVEDLGAQNLVTRHVVAQYARGFVTAHNFYNRRQIAVTLPDSTVNLYLEKFCRDNPLSDVAAGVVALAKTLGAAPLRQQ